VIEDTGVRCPNVGVEAAVEDTDLTPVCVESLDVVVTNARSKGCLLEGHAHGTHRRLGGGSGHAINCNIDDICASSSTSEHASCSNTCGVVRVNVDGEVGVRLANSANQAKRLSAGDPDEVKKKTDMVAA
jgi:hypothetical protein